MPRIIYFEKKEEATTKPGAYPVDNTIYKYLTFSEKMIMFAVIFGIISYCMKKKYANNWKLAEKKEDKFE